MARTLRAIIPAPPEREDGHLRTMGVAVSLVDVQPSRVRRPVHTCTRDLDGSHQGYSHHARQDGPAGALRASSVVSAVGIQVRFADVHFSASARTKATNPHRVPIARAPGETASPGALASTPDRIRTCDLCLRRAALYPAELRAQRQMCGISRVLSPAEAVGGSFIWDRHC